MNDRTLKSTGILLSALLLAAFTGCSGPAQIGSSPSPSFSLGIAPSGIAIAQSSSGTSQITVTAENGFAGNVNLTASGLPSGVSASFSPSSANETSTLTLTASSTATPGAYTFTINGTSGSLSVTTSFSLSVTAASSPTITSFVANPSTITAGSNSSLTAMFSGGTGVITPGNISVTSGNAVSVSPTATTTYTLTVTPTSGSAITQTVKVTVNAVSGPTITSFVANPSTITSGSSSSLTAMFSGGTGVITPGNIPVTSGNAVSVSPTATTTYTLTVTPTSGSAVTQTVTVTVNAASGPTITSFVANPPTITSGSSSSLTAVFSGGTGVITPGNISVTSGNAVSVSPTATTTYTLTVTPTSGSAIAQTVAVTVNAASGPAITNFVANPTTITSGSSSSLTAVFSGGTGVITPGNISVTSGNAVSVSPTATTTYTLTVTPTSGSAIAQAVTVTVQPGSASFTLGSSPASLSINQGSTDISTIAVTDLGGFTGAVSLSASGLPTGISASFAPDPTPTSGVLYLSANNTAATGTTTVTITGTSGTVTASTTISLTVTSGNCTPTTITPGINYNGSWVQVTSIGVPLGASIALNAVASDGGGTWKWTGPNGYASTSDPVYGIPLSVGNNVFVATYTSSTGCKSTQTFNVTEAATNADFSLSADPDYPVVAQGASTTSTITVNNYGISGNVSLAAVQLPPGVTASFAPSSTASTSVLTLTASSTAASGYVIITGTSGSLSLPITIPVTVVSPVQITPNFSLGAAPVSLAVTQGSSITTTISVTGQNGFVGNVSLLASGLPSGVSASFSPPSTGGTSVLTLTASGSAAPGITTITVSGSSGSLSELTTISLTVNPALVSPLPSFTLNDAPTSLSIAQGTSGTTTITVNGQNGFNDSVRLTAISLPLGVSASFTPNSTAGTSTLTLIADSSAPTGTYTITINGGVGALFVDGQPGSIYASTTLSLTVLAAQSTPNFSLSSTPGSLGIKQGYTSTSQIAVTALSGFAGSVTLAASGLPSGVTASFSPASTNGNSTLTLTADGTAIAGTYVITVNGTSGTTSAETTVNLIVNDVVPPLVACTPETPVGILGLCTFPTAPIDVDPGTTASMLGAPSTTEFNGLGMIKDTLTHVPKHGVPATWSTMPAPLVDPTMPTISDIVVLNRRDTSIIYVPPVAGAADYRAYIYDPATVTFKGAQPRGAVVACAGTRQRFELNADALLFNNYGFAPIEHREVVQAIEVPGLVNDGTYQIIVEALATPCPFVGVMGHEDADLSLTFYNLGITFPIVSFSDVMAEYGNEIINGQGSTLTDYKNANEATSMPVEPVGIPVLPTDTVIPTDPVVLARSAISVVRPAADEATNAPVIDVGPNSFVDDFSTDDVMTTLHAGARPDDSCCGLSSEGQFGNEFFWMIHAQPSIADATNGGVNPTGAQVWRRHGRLYSSFGDNGQDVFAGLYFSPTAVQPEKLDSKLYVHSMFRVNSEATGRRYWHWMMCGAATPGDLADPTTGIPYGRPVGTPFFMLTGGAPGGPNAGQVGYNVSQAMDGEPTTQYQLRECVNLIQIGATWGGPPSNANLSSWFDQPHSQLNAFIDPAGVQEGIINLKPGGIQDGDANATGGMLWRLDDKENATQPMFEPFDQEAPLTHYDVFVRPDRIVFFINGRQAFCSDLSDRPLTMKYGEIAYGSVLYHSGAEIMTDYVGQAEYMGAEGGSTHYVMNTPWADTRIWDFIGQSQETEIPTQFSFDPRACFKPYSTAVQ